MSYIFLKLIMRLRFYSPVWLSVLLVIPLCNTVQSRDNWDSLNVDTRTVSFETSEGTYLGFDIAPDGKWIVFDLLGQLWRIPTDGGRAEQLTDAVADTAEDLDPNFSPDGKWVAFWSDRPEGSGIYIIPAEGGTPRLLSGTETRPRVYPHPTWSPDGERLAFIRNNELHIYHFDRDTTKRVELSGRPDGGLEHPAWLPDGRLILRFSQARGWMVDPEGPLWLVNPETGEGDELPTGGLSVLAPSPSSDGSLLAYFAQDEEGEIQLWVQDIDDDSPQQLTHQKDVLPLRARWIPEGGEILYSAEGYLWAINLSDGINRRIQFNAHVEFDRYEPELPAVKFPNPGEVVPARGHMGLTLSPGGKKIAKLALEKLWVWTIGEAPEAVTDVPIMAQWPSWSPDEKEITWSAGRVGTEDIYVTNLETGNTRRLTNLPGKVERPAWSPDGEKIAFFYHPGVLSLPLEDPDEARRGRFAVISLSDEVITDTMDLYIPPTDHPLRLWGYYIAGQERPVWSPDSDALLIPEEEYNAQILPLKGDAISLNIEGYPAFLNWNTDSSFIFVQGNQIWRAEMQNNSVQEPVRLTEEPSLYPSVARDGTVLYISSDGYRLRRPDGTIESLGWPLTYRIPEPGPLLIKDTHIIDGTGENPSLLKDILIENGRIARVEPAGSIIPDDDVDIIESDGRFVIPGLIDLHQHGWDEDDIVYAACLYHGMTTIREMGGPIARNAALGEAAMAGPFQGPRVVLGGFQLYPGLGEGVTGAGFQRPQTKEEGDRALALARAFDASYAKMRLPGSWQAGAELIRLAHDHGMRIGGHCAHPLPLVAAGIHQVEHVGMCGNRSGMLPRNDLVRLYREAGVDVIPTLAIDSGGFETQNAALDYLRDPEIEAFVTPILRMWGGYDRPVEDDVLQASKHFMRAGRAFTGRLYEAGVRIGAGSDLPTFPAAIHLDLVELVAAGLTPLEAIRAATSDAAHILGAEQEIGTVEEGKIADLVLLDADPLEDIRNTREIWKVIKGGEIVDREGLLEWAKEIQVKSNQ
jgi:Tol biopolymer transport system component